MLRSCLPFLSTSTSSCDEGAQFCNRAYVGGPQSARFEGGGQLEEELVLVKHPRRRPLSSIGCMSAVFTYMYQ